MQKERNICNQKERALNIEWEKNELLESKAIKTEVTWDYCRVESKNK